MNSFRYQVFFIALATVLPCAWTAESIATQLCGEWKGEDGNIHTITTDKWTTTLPNGLKKEKKFEVVWIPEPKGVWIKVSPVEFYFFLINPDTKKTYPMGPRPDYRSRYDISSPDVITTLHLSQLNKADGEKIAADYKSKQAQQAPTTARNRIRAAVRNQVFAEIEVSKLESDLKMYKTNPPPPSQFLIDAAGSLEAAQHNNREYVKGRIQDIEKSLLPTYAATLDKSKNEIDAQRAKFPDISDAEIEQYRNDAQREQAAQKPRAKPRTGE